MVRALIVMALMVAAGLQTGWIYAQPQPTSFEAYNETYGAGRALRLGDDWTEVFRLEVVKALPRGVVRGVRIEIR